MLSLKHKTMRRDGGGDLTKKKKKKIQSEITWLKIPKHCYIRHF
jgi:hypothetical protein